MTKNQIEYQKLLETKRSNLAQEGQKKAELAETSRHNLVYEGETERHNRAVEYVSMEELGYKRKQSEASMIQARAADKNAETQRLNHLEAARSNRVYESIGIKNAQNQATQAAAAWESAQANSLNAPTNAYNAETQRLMTESNITKNTAQTELIQTDTGYRKQENTRGWIDTGAKAVGQVGNFIGSMMKGLTALIPLV